MRAILLFTILFIHCFHSLSMAKGSDFLHFEYPAINYSTKNGLPSNETYCVFQDSKGYIWIGTDRGIVKFDGYHFKTFTTLDGLTDNVILAINEDNQGNIWYSALNNLKVGYIDTNMVFHKYSHQSELEQSKANSKGVHFNEIYIDGNDKYLVNNKSGYIIINDQGVKKSTYNHKRKNAPYNLDLKEIDKNGWDFIYYSSQNTNSENTQLFNHHILSYNNEDITERYPTSLKQKSTQYIYDGYNKITINDGKIKRERLQNKCSGFRLNSNFYIFSSYGKNEENSIVYFSNSANFHDNKTKLTEGLRVTRVIQDLKGGIWVASTRKGIYYFPNLNSKLTPFNDPIEAIYPTENGIHFNTLKQAFEYNIETKRIIEKSTTSNKSSIQNSSDKISFFNFTPLVFKDSISKYNQIDISGYQSINENTTYFWNKYNLIQTEKENNNFTIKSTIPLPYRGNIYCFKEDSCLVSSSAGMNLQLKDTLVHLNIIKNKPVRHIEYFKEKKVLAYSIWGEGLNLYFPDGHNIKLSKENGLASNTINSIFLENDTKLWIGTNQGINTLCLQDSMKYELKTILKGSKKLSSPNILQIYSKKDILFLGTDAGLNIVDLQSKDNHVNSPLLLERIEINNKPIQGVPDHLTLCYDSNTINFHFTSLTYNMFGQVNYRFRLLGLSESWIYTKDRKAKFLQLIPGEYSFEIEAKNEFDEWIPNDKTVSFTILKPFWQTWWFLTLLSLMAVIIIGGILYYHITNLKREKLFIKNEKALSDELNQSQQKALNAQLNPHFVFNSLNSIQHYILTQKVELSSDYLSLFSKLMRFVFENSKKLYIPLEDEIEALKLYLSLEKVRHNNSFDFDISIDFNSSETVNINIPSLLIQPIVENAIWHGLLPKSIGPKHLNIIFKMENNELNIIVVDNGIGRSHSSKRKRVKVIKKQKSSGEELTKQRLDLLQTAVGLPTTFTILNLYDSEGNSSGTRVSIKIPNNLNLQE